MRSLFNFLRRRNDGGTAVEFSLIAPVFFMIMWGTVEVAMLALSSTLLEGAVREAARVGMTGYSPTGTARADHIKNTVQKYASNFLDITKITIDTKSYTGFDSIGQAESFTDSNSNGVYNAGESFTDTNGNGQWDADQGKTGLGDPGTIVLYTLTYDWNWFAGYAKTIFGVTPVKLKASVAVRNEPY